jgi:hypothetical protein
VTVVTVDSDHELVVCKILLKFRVNLQRNNVPPLTRNDLYLGSFWFRPTIKSFCSGLSHLFRCVCSSIFFSLASRSRVPYSDVFRWSLESDLWFCSCSILLPPVRFFFLKSGKACCNSAVLVKVWPHCNEIEENWALASEEKLDWCVRTCELKTWAGRTTGPADSRKAK